MNYESLGRLNPTALDSNLVLGHWLSRSTATVFGRHASRYASLVDTCLIQPHLDVRI